MNQEIICLHFKIKKEEMGIVTRNQSEHLAKFKLNEFLKKHRLLLTRELKMCNLIQMFDFLSSFEARVLVCRNEAFGHVVAKNYLNLLLKACALRLLITILERSSRNEVRSYSTQCLTNHIATSVSVRATNLSLN